MNITCTQLIWCANSCWWKKKNIDIEKIITSKRWHDQDWFHTRIISQEVLHWWEKDPAAGTTPSLLLTVHYCFVSNNRNPEIANVFKWPYSQNYANASIKTNLCFNCLNLLSHASAPKSYPFASICAATFFHTSTFFNTGDWKSSAICFVREIRSNVALCVHGLVSIAHI